MVELFKGRGSMSIVKNYRDITMGDQDAKAVGRWLRGKLLAAVAAITAVTQWGSGLHGGETAITHLQVRTYVEMLGTN